MHISSPTKQHRMTQKLQSIHQTNIRMQKTAEDKLMSSSHSSYILTLLPSLLLLLLSSLVCVAIFYRADFTCYIYRLQHRDEDHHKPRNQTISAAEKTREEQLPFAIGEANRGSCDVFSGRWVRDGGRPLYEERECPYIEPQWRCEERGRPDKEYLRWRWQPNGCSTPRFNATLMLETLRGKRMMFVGDSLNRGQFLSMVCLLNRVIPENSKSLENFGTSVVFTAKDYNATVEFYWAPFLLESNSDAVIHRVTDRIVRKGSIDKHGEHWKGVDVIVFNTYLWWMTGLEFKILRGSFDDDEKDIVMLPTEKAYRMAIESMLSWVKKNMNPEKTRVFFMSMSPTHEKSVEWGGNLKGSCYNETTMIDDPTYWGSDCRKSIMQVIEEVFSKSKVPITFMNITQLSSYRKDAHTSIYRRPWKPLTPEELANPMSYADCVHWCIPGLQDTWNELLFSKLLYP